MTRRHLIAAGALYLLGCSAHASSSPSAESPTPSPADADALDDIEAKHTAERFRLPTPGSDIDTGAAMILIEGSMDDVLEQVLAFEQYKDVFPRLQDSRVVARKGAKTDVYMRAPILNNSTAIWMVARFGKPRPWRDKGKKIVGRFVKGNLKAWSGVWKLYPKGPKQTVLRMELFIDVMVPVPNEWVTPELEWASDKAVTAVRDLVEKGASSVKDD